MERKLTVWFSMIALLLVVLGSLGEIVPGLILLLASFFYPPFLKDFINEAKVYAPQKRFFTQVSFIFALWAALATLFVNPSSSVSWGIFVGLLIVIFPVFFAGIYARKLDSKFLWHIFIFGAGLATVLIFYDYFIVGNRRAELLVGCNAAGTLLLIALATFLATFYKEKDKRRWFYLGASFFTVVGIILTASRAAWIGMAVMFVSLPLFGAKTKQFLAIILVVTLVLGLIIFTNSYWKQRFLTIFDLDQNSARLNAYEASISMMTKHPFGIGLGNFESEHRNYLPEDKNPLSHAHNIYLQFGAELGFVGFVLSVLIYLTVPLMCFKIAKVKPYFGPIGAGFLAIFVRELFDATTLGLAVAGFVWFLFGLVFAEYVALKNDLKENAKV